jgi:peptide/nickel transport system ATP-binding protein
MDTLVIEGLEVKYASQGTSVHAVNNVSFVLPKNESLGIVGESGCGKSTLGLSIIRAHQEKTSISGKIIFDGKSILDMSPKDFAENIRWKEISMIFQGAMNSLDPVFTIRQQFVEILKKHKFQGDAHQIIEHTILQVGLSESVLDRFPHELSGGMKQRVVIAMALLLRPKIVIADEPTTALDVLVQAQIINVLKELKKQGLSIVLISHDIGIISEIAEKIAIMYAGEIVEFGNLDEIYRSPMHPYTVALLNSTPKLKTESKITVLEGAPPSMINLPEGCKFYDRCPHAMDKCRKNPAKINTKSGYVMCWLYE